MMSAELIIFTPTGFSRQRPREDNPRGRDSFDYRLPDGIKVQIRPTTVREGIQYAFVILPDSICEMRIRYTLDDELNQLDQKYLSSNLNLSNLDPSDDMSAHEKSRIRRLRYYNSLSKEEKDTYNRVLIRNRNIARKLEKDRRNYMQLFQRLDNKLIADVDDMVDSESSSDESQEDREDPENLPDFIEAVTTCNIDAVKKHIASPHFDIKEYDNYICHVCEENPEEKHADYNQQILFKFFQTAHAKNFPANDVIWMTRILLNLGANVDGVSICTYCLDFMPGECLQLLLNAGVDYMSPNGSPLNFTPINFARSLHPEKAEILERHDPELKFIV